MHTPLDWLPRRLSGQLHRSSGMPLVRSGQGRGLVHSANTLGRARSGGFSLVELLVSIAVVGVLASILVAVLSGSRLGPLQAKNSSQLRSIGAAVRLFATEHDGLLPQYGFPAANTHGVDASWRSPARALFGKDKQQLGPAHALGNGDYLDDVAVFYSPLLSHGDKLRRDGGFYQEPNGRRIIGYYLFSFPSDVVGGRNPVRYNNQLIANETVHDWERSPLYTDFLGDYATQYGFEGDKFFVLHIDGSVSARDKRIVDRLYATSGARCYYYLGTGREE